MDAFHESSKHAANLVQNSLLLTIPGEIRNKIYEYVLTSSVGLTFEFGQPNPPRFILVEGGERRPFNNLKHVCKQLAFETQYLDLQYNRVAIESDAVLSLDQVFQRREKHSRVEANQRLSFLIRSLRSLAPSRIGWLSKITIHARGYHTTELPSENPHAWSMILHLYRLTRVKEFNQRPDSLQPFDKLCQQYPHLSIQYLGLHLSREQLETKDKDEIVLYGVMMAIILRGQDLSFLLHSRTLGCFNDYALLLTPSMRKQSRNLTACFADEQLSDDVKNGILRLKEEPTQDPTERAVMQYLNHWIINGI